MRIALFPLNTVLFPAGALPLRIFEPRYLSMISRCLREDAPFGVVLIRDGTEAGDAADFHTVGTLAHITDWNRLPDGLLGISAVGGERFTVQSSSVARDQLITANIELLEAEPVAEYPQEFTRLADLLQRVIDAAGPADTWDEPALDDPVWVGHRLSEILPLPLEIKQTLLELNDPLERLRILTDLVNRLQTP